MKKLFILLFVLLSISLYGQKKVGLYPIYFADNAEKTTFETTYTTNGYNYIDEKHPLIAYVEQDSSWYFFDFRVSGGFIKLPGGSGTGSVSEIFDTIANSGTHLPILIAKHYDGVSDTTRIYMPYGWYYDKLVGNKDTIGLFITANNDSLYVFETKTALAMSGDTAIVYTDESGIQTFLEPDKTIYGIPVSSTPPTSGQILKFNGTAYAPASDNSGSGADGVADSIYFSGITTKTLTLTRTEGLPNLTATFTDNVNDADANATNELQYLTKSGSTVSLSNGGGSFTDDVNDADANPTNELQTISKSGMTVTLSDGGGSFTDEVDDADASTINELQTISKTGTTVTLSNGGGSFTLSDDDASNELQTITRSSNLVTLSDGGGSVSIDDADYDPTNELQTISKSGNTVTLSDGGGSFTIEGSVSEITDTIPLTGYYEEGYTIALHNDGTGKITHIVVPNTIYDNLASPPHIIGQIFANGDGMPKNVYETVTSLAMSGDSAVIYIDEAGDTTLIEPDKTIRGIPVSSTPPLNGQILKYNGTAYVPADDDATGGTGTDGVVSSAAFSGTTTKTLTLTRTEGLSNLTATFTDNVNDSDADPTNELQTISKSGSTVTLSDGGGSISVNDADYDPTNEIQIVSEGYAINIVKTGEDYNVSVDTTLITTPYDLSQKDINDADSDPTNELQTISKTGTTITLSDGGGSVTVDDADADATNEIQTISKSGTTVTLSDGGGSFTDEVDDADYDPTNELQTISKSGTTVTLSDGGGSFTDEVDDADADATNEIQTISKSGVTVTLSGGGGSFTVDDADADATNELQTISKSGSTVTLSDGGGSFTDEVNDADYDPTNENQTVSEGYGINITHTGQDYEVEVDTTKITTPYDLSQKSVDDADADPTNEIQTISKSGTTVTLSDGGGSFTVDDADASTSNELQTISKSGSTVTLSDGGGSFTVDDADADATNEIQTISENWGIDLVKTGNNYSVEADSSQVASQYDLTEKKDIIQYDLTTLKALTANTETALKQLTLGGSTYTANTAVIDSDVEFIQGYIEQKSAGGTSYEIKLYKVSGGSTIALNTITVAISGKTYYSFDYSSTAHKDFSEGDEFYITAKSNANTNEVIISYSIYFSRDTGWTGAPK